MSIFKRHRYEIPAVTVKVDTQDLERELLKTRSHVETLVSDLATNVAKQEEDIKRLQQAVAVLESGVKVALFTNDEIYKATRHG